MPQPNMQQMMKQVQKLQQEMTAAQEALAEATLEGSSGGGMVVITITGDQQIKAVKIKPEAIDPDDPEMLEDLVLAAINDAKSKAEALAQEKLGGLGGGLGGMPGMPPGLGL